MSKVIYKYALEFGLNRLPLKMDAQIVHFAEDPLGVLSCWVLLDLDNPYQDKKLYVLGTGQLFSDPLTHVGSCRQGPYIWHLLEHADD